MALPTSRTIPIIVAQTSAARDRPLYEIRDPAGDVLHTMRSQTQLRDMLLALARVNAPEERLEITGIGLPRGEALGEAGPIAVDPAAAHVAAHDPHHVPVPVVGAAVAVFAHRPAELGDDQDDRVLPWGPSPSASAASPSPRGLKCPASWPCTPPWFTCASQLPSAT